MIGYISCIIAFILCTFVYVRMARREVSGTLGKKSVIPVLLGLVAPILTFVLVILFGAFITKYAGKNAFSGIDNLVLRSLAKAFVGAGFTEEFMKLLLALLAVAIVKPKNVYSYALMFVGVGFGFTALEEVIYGGGNDLISLARLPGFAIHMVLGIIMGVNLGIARYEKKQGVPGSGAHVFMGLVLPVAWHTVYDATTVDNAGIETESDMAILAFLIVDIATIVMQFVLLSKFKKKSAEYCQMEV